MMNGGSRMKIAIIGGGASGLYAAYLLSKELINARITIFERSDKCGKKILMSGNGRGNLSNLNIAPYHYNDVLGYQIAMRHSPRSLQGELLQMGLVTYADEEGRVYPVSESSNSILDSLRLWNAYQGVQEKVGSEVVSLHPKTNGYEVVTLNHVEFFDIVIIALGSKAGYSNQNLTRKIDESLDHLGYNFQPFYPSLTPLYVHNPLRSLSGLRVSTHASLWINGENVYDNMGEVLFKNNSLSGILIFELSSFYARAQQQHNVKEAAIKLNLFPQYNSDQLYGLYRQRRLLLAHFTMQEYFTGLLPKAIGYYLIKECKIDLSSIISDLSDEQLSQLVITTQALTFMIDLSIVSPQSQVFCGGIDLVYINKDTLESKHHKNLYFMGEYLNIDGLCGGYNLHFAFASAYVVSQAIKENRNV